MRRLTARSGQNAPVTGVRSLLFPRSVAIVGASPRHAEAVGNDGAQRRHSVGREPEPRRGGRPALLPDASPTCPRHPKRPSCSSTTSAWRRACRRARGRRAGVRRPGRRGGGRCGTASDVAKRLAALVREAGACVLGPNCMGMFAPGGPAAWIGDAPPTTAPGSRGRALPVGVDRGRLPLARRAHRPALRRLVGRRGGHRRGRLPRASSPRTRARAPSGCSSRRCAGRPRSLTALAACAAAGKPVVCLKVGRSEAAARAALSHTGALVGSVRAFSARAAPLRGDRGGGLPRARRDARDPRSPPLAARHAHRARSRSRVASAPSSPTTRRPRASRSSRCPTQLADALPAEFPNYPRPRQPARRLGGGRRERRLPAIARAAGASRARSTCCSRSPTCRSFAT